MVHVVTYPSVKTTLSSMWTHIRIIPFETAISLFCVVSGVFGLFAWGLNNDQFISALGIKIANAFNVGYIVAGLGMFLGLAINRKDLETFGLTCVVISLLVRSSAIAWKVGINPVVITSYVFNAILIGACITRAWMIYKYKVIVQQIVEDGHNHVA